MIKLSKIKPSAAQFRPILIQLVPPSTNQYPLILTQYHQVQTSTALYWPSTTKYQPVPPFTDQVPALY